MWPVLSQGVFSSVQYLNAMSSQSRDFPVPMSSLHLPSVSHAQGRKFVYAGSNSGVVQAPLAFCGKHSSCEDCVLARDPYCAWSPAIKACVSLHQAEGSSRYEYG